MNEFYSFLIDPFIEYGFMRHALLSVLYLSLSSVPIGIFLVMRRMSLVGDALSHSILPGVSIAYIFSGLSLPWLSLGGIITGFIIVIVTTLASYYSNIKEDANFAAFYLTCLALGVLIISYFGSNIDLLHLLFGSILSINQESIFYIASVSSISLFILAIVYRPLISEIVDSELLKIVQVKSQYWYLLFQFLVVINLVSGFQTMGTLMSVGLMMLPAIIAKLWFARMSTLLVGSILISIFSGISGLLLSFYVDLPSGPAIILISGLIYILSLFLGSQSGILSK